MLHDVFIYPLIDTNPSAPTYLIEHTSPSNSNSNVETEIEPLLKHLKKYVLRAKVKIQDVSEEYDIWSALNDKVEGSWQPSRSWKFGNGGAAEPTWNMGGEESIKNLGCGEKEIAGWDLRAGWGEGSLGKRILVRKGDKRKFSSSIFNLNRLDRLKAIFPFTGEQLQCQGIMTLVRQMIMRYDACLLAFQRGSTNCHPIQLYPWKVPWMLWVAVRHYSA